MKEDTRKRLSELILEELSEKIKKHEGLKKKLEAFTDLPVEKVADTLLNQFEFVLSSDLRDLIIYLIEQELGEEQGITPEPALKEQSEKLPVAEPPPPLPEEKPVETAVSPSSIMEHFGVKEAFATEPIDFELKSSDWFYLYGVSYAPESTGKGVPTRKLLLTGVDGVNNLFLLDYGDVRFYVSKLNGEDYTLDKMGKPVLPSLQMSRYKFEHEWILNLLRSEDVIMPLPFWTIIQGRERIINRIEDHYVELLRVLIDVHDALDWDVEVFANDQHIIEMPAIHAVAKDRPPQRDTKHPVPRGKDVKIMEKLMIREKGIAQEIHSSLLIHATKTKVDYMVRLDNAFMDDWKSILSVRYTIGKEKRKAFWHEIKTIQTQYEEYELMIHIGNPNTRFTFT